MRFLDGGGIHLERPLHERALSLHVHELLQRLSRQADVAGDLDTIDDMLRTTADQENHEQFGAAFDAVGRTCAFQ